MEKPIVDWYINIITIAKNKNCIVNILNDNNEAWLVVNNKKYVYKAWQLPFDNIWLKGIFLKTGNTLDLLTDRRVKNLYDEIDNIEILIKEETHG